MNSTLKYIVFGLGLPFGLSAFAIGLSIGDDLATAAVQAVGWWLAFSTSNALAYLPFK